MSQTELPTGSAPDAYDASLATERIQTRARDVLVSDRTQADLNDFGGL